MKKIAAVFALGVVLALPVAAHAQGSLAGTWTSAYPTRVTNENGNVVASETRPSTMTLTLMGDSVLGTWHLDATAGGAAPAPIHLKGTRVGTKVTLTADAVERNINIGDGPKKVMLSTVYTFELKGDVLTGTQKNVSTDGSFEGPELDYLAKRIKP